MDIKIAPYKSTDKETITKFFPPEWNFDFKEFLSRHNNRDYFRGFSLLDGGEPIGFGNLMVFGTICWIGNIVVSEKHRKKGFGTKITEYLMQTGRDLGAVTFNLVATEPGEPIYRKLGFKTECMYEFYKLKGKPPELKASGKIREANPSDLREIVDLDHHTTGERREEMISSFLTGSFVMDRENTLTGFFIRGLGDGLIVGIDTEAGIELLKKKIVYSDRQIVLPESNVFAKDFLLDCGFNKTMELPRMTLGEKCNWKPEHIFSRGTGYCG